jgi:hypothetical protein
VSGARPAERFCTGQITMCAKRAATTHLPSAQRPAKGLAHNIPSPVILDWVFRIVVHSERVGH